MTPKERLLHDISEALTRYENDLITQKAMELIKSFSNQHKNATEATEGYTEQHQTATEEYESIQSSSKASQATSERKIWKVTTAEVLRLFELEQKPLSVDQVMQKLKLHQSQKHAVRVKINYLIGKNQLVKIQGKPKAIYKIPDPPTNPAPPKPHPQTKQVITVPHRESLTESDQIAAWHYIRENPDSNLIKIMRGLNRRDYGSIYKTLEKLVQKGEIIRQKNKTYIIS